MCDGNLTLCFSATLAWKHGCTVAAEVLMGRSWLAASCSAVEGRSTAVQGEQRPVEQLASADCNTVVQQNQYKSPFLSMLIPSRLPDGVDGSRLLALLRRIGWGSADILRSYARAEQPPFGFSKALNVSDGREGPVSAADMATNTYLLRELTAAFPAANWTVLSEETAKLQPHGDSLPSSWIWILDPLDGTRDFLQGSGEYAVHLGLVHQGYPVLGVVVLPEAEELWFGVEGRACWCEDRLGARQPARLSKRNAPEQLVLVTSRSHRDGRLERLVAGLGLKQSRAVGSVGCKIATILRGEADVYLSLSGRSAPKDWDMAAPEAVLVAAGGAFSHADGSPLVYNHGQRCQAGCLIASHGPCHGELERRAAAAMINIDPGFRL